MKTAGKKEFKLQIQPVPPNNWGDSLANLLPKPVWDALRKGVYKRAGHKCEVCGNVLKTLHCHENWVYNDWKGIQKLYSLISLCSECHNCVHWFGTEKHIKLGNLPPEKKLEV